MLLEGPSASLAAEHPVLASLQQSADVSCVHSCTYPMLLCPQAHMPKSCDVPRVQAAAHGAMAGLSSCQEGRDRARSHRDAGPAHKAQA